MARPQKDRPRIMAAVCDRIAYDGELVEDAAKAEGVNPATIWKWAVEDAELGKLYARARVLSAEGLEREALQVARASTPETYQADTVLINTLKWAAAKRHPKVYSDKVDVTTDGEKLQPSQTIVIGDRKVLF